MSSSEDDQDSVSLCEEQLAEDARKSCAAYDPLKKQLIFNKYLPYSVVVEEEATSKLTEIKLNLGRAVLLRELRPGCYYWSIQLSTYICLHGVKMSTDDHVAFIHLFYELVTVPDLEFFLVQHFSQVLTSLLTKRHFLSRQDLVLEWRPLYGVYQRVCLSRWDKIRMIRIPNGTNVAVISLVRVARTYFPVESTAEMLVEWRPWFCPYVRKLTKRAMDCFELFLPLTLYEHEHEQGFRLWFNEFVQIWLSCDTSPAWESCTLSLFSRLAEESVGHIDWNPYIPTIFTRLLRSLHLPVTLKQVRMQACKDVYNLTAVATFLVSMLGGGSRCQEHLVQLFKTLQSFYHPSNSGAWNVKLQELLSKLSTALLKRLRRERRLRHTWLPDVPLHSRLTEDDITAFVQCLRPCVLLAMFSKSGCKNAAMTLKNLSVLRPELIVPPVLERFYPAVETLTEPHRLLSVIQCLSHVVVALVGSRKFLPEGPSHVLPILNSCLPAIDPNDLSKTLSAFQLIICIVEQISLVDCSQLVADRSDLNEVERELCLATCQFEDFVLQFMDRCFLLVENASLEPSLMTDGAYDSVTAEEEQLQWTMSNVFGSILVHSSRDIVEVAVRKLHAFVTGRIMGIKDAGYMAAKLVHATVQRDAFSVTLLLPSVCRVIEENVVDMEEGGGAPSHPGNEILFNMLLLQELVCCDGRILLPYRDTLVRVLTKVTHLTDKDGHNIACNTLKNLLAHLTTIYHSEYGGARGMEQQTVDDQLPIRDWGKTVDLKTLEIPWHTGSAEETAFAQQLVDTFLLGNMKKLSDVCEGSLVMSREQLQQSLSVVYSSLLGCLSLCPPWDGTRIPVVDSVVSTEAKPYTIVVKDAGILAVHGERNLREEVVINIRRLMQHLLKNNEDNTIAFRRIIKIYFRLLFYWGTHYETWQQDWKGWQKAKKLMQNPLKGKNKHFRLLFIQRVSLQHHIRASEFGLNHFSELHKSTMQDLLTMSISRYAEVRVLAQWLLGECFKVFVYSYKHLLSDLASLVNCASDFEHHKLKGMLHVLLGEQVSYCLLTRRDWQTINLLWPVVVETTISDKPSINVLLDSLVDKVNKQFDTFAICETMTQAALDAARRLLTCSTDALPSDVSPTDEEVCAAGTHSDHRNISTVALYKEVVLKQAKLVESPNLHWQNQQLGLELLSLLFRHDAPFPPDAVRVMLHALVHDSLASRKVALPAVVRILEQLKPRIPHVEVEPVTAAGHNNASLFYDPQGVPLTEEDWNGLYFVDKPHLGFYKWPRKLMLHAPPGLHPVRWLPREDMSEAERVVHDFFMSPSNVDKLVAYLSAEGNVKEQDKLELMRCHLFKHLFRNLGDRFLPLMKPHLDRLLCATQDSNKRCGLEIVAGLVAGSKHWTYDMLCRLWTYLAPLMRLALGHINVEIQTDWGRGISYMMSNRDPRRMKWLLEMLMEDLLGSNEGSFLEANRLLLLGMALNEQPWRLPGALCRVLDIIRPHLGHPYQNIRDELGRVLAQLFLTNTDLHPFPNGHRGPLQSAFVEEIVAELETFEKAMVATVTDGSSSGAEVGPALSENDEKWKSSVALLKTVCRWLRRRIFKSLQWTSADLFRLFNALCQGDTYDRDPELKLNCRVSIAIMAHSYLPLNLISSALKTVIAASHSSSWRLRRTCTEFLQVLLFSNLFTVLEHPDCMETVHEMVLRLLQDTQPEVQQVAALVLSGMFHSEILKVDHILLDKFVSLSKTPIRKKKGPAGSTAAATGDALQHRHAGVLGLCAFVGAHPYEVVDGMPEVLMTLGDHLHDPQPLQSTVRLALTNFWRTHRDNWHDHKSKFTDDQLAVLTDLLVSPNYYA